MRGGGLDGGRDSPALGVSGTCVCGCVRSLRCRESAVTMRCAMIPLDGVSLVAVGHSFRYEVNHFYGSVHGYKCNKT